MPNFNINFHIVYIDDYDLRLTLRSISFFGAWLIIGMFLLGNGTATWSIKSLRSEGKFAYSHIRIQQHTDANKDLQLQTVLDILQNKHGVKFTEQLLLCIRSIIESIKNGKD